MNYESSIIEQDSIRNVIINSTGDESTLKNHLYLSKIVFGVDSPAVRWLQEQIAEHGEDWPVDVEEREYFAFLKGLNNKTKGELKR